MRNTPEMSWSLSRHKAFTQCPRKARHQHYTSIGGHHPDADEITRHAFLLKRLVTLPSYLGQELHARAKEITIDLRAGRGLPDLTATVDKTRAAMNRLYKSSKNRAAFVAKPRQGNMLHEVYYCMELSNDQLLRIRNKIQQLTENLLEWPGWAEVASCPADDILLLDLQSVVIDGVPVYAVPDLVFRCPENGWLVVDFKTGSDEGVDLQLALYGLYLQRLGLEGPFLGLCVSLGGEPHERQVELGEDVLEAARLHMTASADDMRRYLVDGDIDANVPLPIEDWPLVPDERACAWCPYFDLCAPEINQQNGPF
jgi:hypothetical protein